MVNGYVLFGHLPPQQILGPRKYSINRHIVFKYISKKKMPGFHTEWHYCSVPAPQKFSTEKYKK
jgi:hypothetical protein